MNVPLPFRIAAGLIATGVEQVRRLPQDLPGAMVTVAGSVARASLRVQQELAELATRGDELLAPLTNKPEENPPWAHFDDDVADEGAAAAADGGAPGSADTPEGTASTQEGGGGAGGSTGVAPGPAAVPDYDELLIAQLRTRLIGLDAPAVAELLTYERARKARAAFLTTLQNRLDTLRAAS